MRKMKDSGIEWIGEIPVEWEVRRNKYSLTFIKGKNPQNLNSEGNGIPYVGASDLDKANEELYSNYTTDTDLPCCAKEDVLILWDGARAGLVGTNLEGAISSTIAKIQTDQTINKRFLFWYINGFGFYISGCVGGTTIPHMNRQFIEDIQMLTIPFESQTAIATYLDRKCSEIDTIVRDTEKTIEEYKKLKQSLITEVVTGKKRVAEDGLSLSNEPRKMKHSGVEWIGDVPEEWEVTKIKLIAKTNSGSTPKNIIDDESSNIIWIRTTDMNDCEVFESSNRLTQDEFESASCPMLPKGTCLVAMYGGSGTIGKCGILGTTATINQALCSMEVNEHYYEGYLFNVLRACRAAWMKYAVGTRKDPNISQEIVRNMNVPMPTISEQKLIFAYLDFKCSEIDKLISEKQTLLQELESYKKSLIYECVTGKREIK